MDPQPTIRSEHFSQGGKRCTVDRYFYITQRGSIATVRFPGLVGRLRRRSHSPRAERIKVKPPQTAERPECPDEEKAAGGLGDLAVMYPPHVNDGHGCCEQANEQHDDVPRSPFGEHKCPVQEDREDEQRSV